jgi:hypothetical protein
MSVKAHHPDYDRLAPVWKTCRDVASGQRAVHQAGEAYLPRLYKEPDQSYEARKKRTPFFNATWRTIAGLVGMLFRIDPKYKVSPAAEKHTEDVTKSGVSLDMFAHQAAVEALTVGRVGVMVDYPSASAEGLTVAQAEALNLRPHMAMYLTEAIINWRTSWLNNRTVLSLVVLAETVETVQADGYTVKSEERYRVLDLEATVEGYVYRVRVFNGKEELVEGPLYPLMGGKKLDYLPFYIFGADDVTPAVSEPPLIDLVDLNVSHYQTSADLEHGAHQTALPQPWIAGVDASIDANGTPIKQEFYIGGGEAWAFPNPETQVGMLEYSGQGLQALEGRLERKEKQMAVLGARMLEDQKKAAETAETAGIHRAGESSALATQGAVISRGLAEALATFDKWAGGSGDVEFSLNSKFFPRTMTAQELTAQVQAWQAGALSEQELFDSLKDGGVISEAADFESHQAQIGDQPPRMAQGVPPAGGTQ